MMNKKTSKFKRVLLILSVLISVIFVSLFFVITYIYNKYDLDTTRLTSLNNGIRVYSAGGLDNTLYNTNRSIVDIETLPEYVKNAFIDIEDKRFYSHNGFDIKRILKSAFVNITTQSKSQGASTISQQLIKNALLTNEKTYSRKIKEIILAIKMEKEFSKDEILEMYLNTIYFGSNAYGIENASKIFFNKTAQDLTLNEACCLAGLIKSPSTYSPRTNYSNAVERKNLVAKTMFNAKDINSEEYNLVINSPIEISKENLNDNSYEKEAIFEACELLGIKERDLINENYQIVTFKDDDLQNEVIKSNDRIIKSAEDSTNSSLDSLSVVVNNNGHVLAYYANSNYNLHNLTRQPASTLKPLAVYLPCFNNNILSPASIILDEEINYSGFSPKNADNSYHGHVSSREALSKSLNVPAVKALDCLGVKNAKETLSSLGVNISNSDLNLSLALGSLKNGVKVLDLVAAYNAVANLGNYYKPCFVDKILDKNNNIIYSHENYSLKVVDSEGCFLVTDILKDCAKSGTAKRLASLNLPIASKTGTASTKKGNTDLFNVSYSSEHTILSWIADVDDIVLPNSLLSSSQPTDINKEICAYLYKNHIPKDFEIPENIEKAFYDLSEYENNHILVKPNHSIERYMLSDYFKKDNLPEIIKDNEFKYNVTITKSGATISFVAKKHETYKIYRTTKQGKDLVSLIKEKNGEVFVDDKDIFRYKDVEYSIENNDGILLGEIIKIKPQDYLFNVLNLELVNNKKKWLV